MRDRAEALDRAETALAPFRRRFSVADSTVTYLDGNSLGSLPRATETHVAGVVRQKSGAKRADPAPGTRAGTNFFPPATYSPLSQGQVVLSDSTTVNLYKPPRAALEQAPAA